MHDGVGQLIPVQIRSRDAQMNRRQELIGRESLHGRPLQEVLNQVVGVGERLGSEVEDDLGADAAAGATELACDVPVWCQWVVSVTACQVMVFSLLVGC
ncbi:hypothetical protein ACFYPC_27325 [Streptomyces sp. NPDC005808]|uniref:hypothetical protein n=1 Tax=Streptomyces sp. NPDC005808 TaxID=3364734 RepID=UPI0036CDEF5B